MSDSFVFRILCKCTKAFSKKSPRGFNRYYYDVEMDGQTKILSVGSKAQVMIEANWPQYDTFEISKSGDEWHYRPIAQV